MLQTGTDPGVFAVRHQKRDIGQKNAIEPAFQNRRRQVPPHRVLQDDEIGALQPLDDLVRCQRGKHVFDRFAQ